MLIKTTFATREDWMKHRVGIGGSDAASVLGISPWRSNVDAWEIITGRKQQPDISDKDVVRYGTEAEKYLRELFALDYPEYEVGYREYNCFYNSDMPFAHASLDGWLTEKDSGRRGVLEIKTTTITSGAALMKWDSQVPAYYFAQLLHYFLVTGCDFAVLKAQLKFQIGGDLDRIETRHYHFERADCEDDIRALEEAERDFWGYVERDECPPLKLNI